MYELLIIFTLIYFIFLRICIVDLNFFVVVDLNSTIQISLVLLNVRSKTESYTQYVSTMLSICWHENRATELRIYGVSKCSWWSMLTIFSCCHCQTESNANNNKILNRELIGKRTLAFEWFELMVLFVWRQTSLLWFWNGFDSPIYVKCMRFYSSHSFFLLIQSKSVDNCGVTFS